MIKRKFFNIIIISLFSFIFLISFIMLGCNKTNTKLNLYKIELTNLKEEQTDKWTFKKMSIYILSNNEWTQFNNNIIYEQTITDPSNGNITPNFNNNHIKNNTYIENINKSIKISNNSNIQFYISIELYNERLEPYFYNNLFIQNEVKTTYIFNFTTSYGNFELQILNNI